jgi:hypothetical protein
MTLPVNPKLRFLTQTKPRADLMPECVEAFQLQEQFTSPVLVWTGRPAAELLAERLAEADPANTSLIFIP